MTGSATVGPAKDGSNQVEVQARQALPMLVTPLNPKTKEPNGTAPFMVGAGTKSMFPVNSGVSLLIEEIQPEAPAQAAAGEEAAAAA